MAENLSFTQKYATYAGKTLGSYSLESLLEQGETGPIFSAHPAHSQARASHRLRLLALPAGLSPEERLLYLGHFQREAARVADLQHAVLLPLHDYGIFEETPYLVFPDQAGLSLQRTLSNHGPASPRRAGHYMDRIALALEYIHQQGILHLNLNARNVFISSHDQPFVAEAGLLGMLALQKSTRDATAGQQPLELENGTPLLRDQQGRPLYGLNLASAPAPELLLGQSPDTSSDVYALGALLYYLLTGHRPMRGRTLSEIADQHLHAAIPSFAIWRQDIPGELDYLLDKAMAKQRAMRVRHPEALANAYAEIIAPGENRRKIFTAPDRLPAASRLQRTAHPSTYPPTNSTSRLSRRRAIMLIATSGSVVAAGITAWVIMHTSATGTPVTSTTGTIPAKSAPVRSNTPGHNGTVIAQTGDIPVNSAKTFPLANSANPGVLIHLPDSQFVAFNSTCTHAGCAVAYNGQSHLLECPCHNASFDPTRNAAVVNGPASSPLAAIAITLNKDGTITTNG